jgi:hypothetical protein
VYRWRTLVTAVVLAASTTALGSGTPSPGIEGRDLVLTGSVGSGHDHRRYSFDIAGTSPKGMYPGATKRIDLVFTNPHSTPLRVHAVRGRLVSTSKTACKPIAANLTVQVYRGSLPLTIPPRGRKSGGSIGLFMPNSVSDSCQGVSFVIRLSGDATKVGR